MKAITLWLLPCLIAGTLISCKDDPSSDEKGSLAIHFKATFDDATLQTFDPQPFATDQRIEFQQMSMLISDLRLFNGGNEVDLDEVELVNMSFDNLTDATEGYTILIHDIPVATYQGIRFGYGVPADVNNKQPSDFPSGNPLSNTGYYWAAWDSYIFSKTEGRLDTLGAGPLDLNFALHTGSDPLYRSLEGPIPVTINAGQRTDISILLDYKDLLNGIDVKSKPQNHNPQDSAQILKIVNNLATALTLSQ